MPRLARLMPKEIGGLCLALWNACAETLYPALCLCCGACLASRDECVCRPCLLRIRRVDPWDEIYRTLRARLAEGGSVTDFIVPWYDDPGGPLRILLPQLKDRQMRRLGRILGEELGRSLLEAGLGEVDAIVPLPLHASAMRQRGFNQSERIARGIACVAGRPVRTHWVIRRRFTAPQGALRAVEHQENVRGAFVVPRWTRRALKGKTVLLVDDLVATGSTMCACSAALIEGGAALVVASAVAISTAYMGGERGFLDIRVRS